MIRFDHVFMDTIKMKTFFSIVSSALFVLILKFQFSLTFYLNLNCSINHG